VLIFIAASGVTLGVAALRHAMLLRGRVDPDLVTTPEATLMDGVATAARVVLVVLLVRLALLVRPWMRDVRDNLQTLHERGLVGAPMTGADGGIRVHPGDDSPWLLVAPVPLPVDGRQGMAAVPAAAGSARLAVVLGAVAMILVAVGSVALFVAWSRDVASVVWLTVAIGGLLLAPASGLLAWLVGDIDRREAMALCAADRRRLLPPDPERRWAAAAIGALVAAAFAVPSLGATAGLDSRECEVATLECRWMVVQADQFSNDPRGATTELHYGLWRATGTRLGTMVLATGGPGYSGMAAWAMSYQSLDPRLTAAFDIVAFDSRGVGQSGYLDCPSANDRYTEELSFDASGSVIDRYVADCLLEIGVDHARLGQYASAQVVEDIDTIREDLGLERIVLYGESYGTAVAQRFALAHPDRLDALILDAPYDIAQSTDGAWTDAAASFEGVLERTFRWCLTDYGCAVDLPDPDGAWRRMMTRLRGEPVAVRYADVSGSMTTWEVGEIDAIDVLGDGLYDEGGRALVLRAMAAADRNDWVPLARLVHSGFVRGSFRDRTASEFVYHATLCADRVVDDDDAANAQSYLESARDSSLASARMGSVFLSGAACHAWPLAPAQTPSVSLPTSATFPVFVLTATGDPITPAATAEQIGERYAATTDVYLIKTTDGPHVTFGRGDSCPDKVIVDFLVDGARPRTDEVHCPGELIYSYTGLVSQETEEDGASYRARSLDIELLVHPDYAAWNREADLAIGCRFGGRLVVNRTEAADAIAVEDCEVVNGSPMRGSGEYRDDGSAWFDVTFPRGRFRYDIAADGTWELEGLFDEKTIDTSG